MSAFYVDAREQTGRQLAQQALHPLRHLPDSENSLSETHKATYSRSQAHLQRHPPFTTGIKGNYLYLLHPQLTGLIC